MDALRTGTPFAHRVAEHAASGALRDLLEHHRLSYAPEPLSEGAIFGLSGALALRARIAPNALPAIDIEGRAASIEGELCSHLGITADWCTTDDPAEAWQQLRTELLAGRPALVRADRGELDYRGDGPHDTRHAIVVTGHDADDGIVWVADQAFPEPQRCTLAALARARASSGWPEPSRHGLLRLRPASRRLADPYAAVWAALQRTVGNMRTPPSSDHPHVRSGLGAIDAVAAAWPALPAMTGERLGQTLGALRFRIRDGGAGGALYRSLQARFLHDAAALLGSARLGQAALVCDDLSDAWRALAGALDIEDADVAHQVAAPWVRRVQRLEHRHVEALEAQLRARRASAA
ncbi:MAG TPA: BtrH N-terminal domain-containing protein [Solirubrobacteraceae bacterium]|nr:BtrH N-terminal domain-containing protein [Solirubrobacteraceae bacterium]